MKRAAIYSRISTYDQNVQTQILDQLTPEQSAYLGIPVEGPYKSDHYRY